MALKLMKNLTIPIRVALLAFRVNHPLVEDNPVVLRLRYHSNILEFGIPFEMVQVMYFQMGFLSLLQFLENSLLHGVIVQHGHTTYVQGKTPHLALHLAPGGLVPVVFSPAGDKLFNKIPLHFVLHIPEVIARLNPG